MTPADMRAWRASMGYTQQQAAQALGVSLRTIKAWESGFAAPPAFLALACAALDQRKAEAALASVDNLATVANDPR